MKSSSTTQTTSTITGLTIGQVAAQSGASIETLRYYERFGLLGTLERTDSNYRIYPTNTIRIVKFIKKAQGLGFSLKDIKQLLYLHNDPTAPSADVKVLSEALLTDISNRIATLQAMHKTLSELVDECSGEPIEHCPIVRALDVSN